MQTFTPVQYLKIDIASNFGLDKETWDHRLQWFDENQDDIELIGMTNSAKVKILPLMKKAEEPALFYAGIKAFMKAKDGEAIGYPISLDATASGAQIMAAIVNCEKSAKLCNVIGTSNREDLYTNIYKLLCQRAEKDELLNRTDTKKAIMTWLYGSSDEPKKVFGEGELLNLFYEVMFEDAPGISELNVGLLNLWDPETDQYEWTLPDNFQVVDKVMGHVKHQTMFMDRPYTVLQEVQMPKKKGLSLSANTVHSIDGMVVREMMRRCMFNVDRNIEIAEMIMQSDYARGDDVRTYRPQDILARKLQNHYEESGFMSARILDVVDHYNMAFVDYSAVLKLLRSMPDQPFNVLAIHDCFRVHPNYANDLRRQYNQILSELANSSILKFIASQITGKSVDVEAFGHIGDQVLEANYALS